MAINMNEIKTNFPQYIISILLAVIGWLLVTTYGSISSKLNEIQSHLMGLQLQGAAIQASEMTDDRVREICRDEFHKLMK